MWASSYLRNIPLKFFTQNCAAVFDKQRMQKLIFQVASFEDLLPQEKQKEPFVSLKIVER